MYPLFVPEPEVRKCNVNIAINIISVTTQGLMLKHKRRKWLLKICVIASVLMTESDD